MTDEPTSIPSGENPLSKEPAPLWLLLIAHVVLGLFFSIWSAVQGRLPFYLADLLAVPVLGIVLAQSSLLGFWAAFSPAKWPDRLAGLITGIICLEFLVGIGLESDGFPLLATISAGGIAAVFVLVRWRYVDLSRLSQQGTHAEQEGLRFSIRGLMLFTFAVAIAIAGVKTLRESVPGESYLLAIPIWSLCFVVIGLASVWAGLGLARPMLRSVVVLLTAVIVGILLVYALNIVDWEMYFYVISMMLLQAVVLIVSLLVVRSCGYRLVRKSTIDVEPLR